jgi:hypothetical protein
LGSNRAFQAVISELLTAGFASIILVFGGGLNGSPYLEKSAMGNNTKTGVQAA